MAISKDTWNKAKAYFEAGKSLNYISEKLDINKSSISRKAKKEEWRKNKTQPLKDAVIELDEEKATLEDKKATVTQQLATLEDYEIEILEELIADEAKIKSLLTNATALNLVRINQHLKENVKEEKYGIGDGMQSFQKVGLSSSDYKQLQDAIDKASITLGVNQRHAPKTDIKVTQGQQTNIDAPEIKGYSVEVISPQQIEEAKATQAIEED